MDYFTVLALPLRTFWMLNRQIDRLRAEQEMRLLRVHASGGSGEAATTHFKALNAEMGQPLRVERQFDEQKFQQLRAKFGKS